MSRKINSIVFRLFVSAPCLGLSALWAQRDLKEIPDPAADKQQASFKLAENLEISLFASDPDIAKPIQMAWDARGRLWVCSSAIYPQVKPGQQADDKIIVLEDTNGDHKADKSTVFTQGLLIPTGVWPAPRHDPAAKNGLAAYVANSTEILYMADTDGDGKADSSEVVLSGFGTEDTHHIIHGFKVGPDGKFYFLQSVYIHSHVETPYGTRRLLGSGSWQYDRLSGQLEIFTLGQVNPWGLVWDRWGQSFTTDGAYGEGINYAFPGATFRCLPDQRPRILKGLNPGQPKQCGLEIISGSHFPDDWQGTLVTNDFRGHRVNRFRLSDDGSGYASTQLEDVITTTHQAFRPIDARMGPDGALYIADWYNPIIQHGEVDFRDPRRDKTHGRIWRVTYKGRELCKQPDYTKASIAELLEMLKAKEDWVRLWAKEELRGRNTDEVGPALAAALGKAAADAADAWLLELLWLADTVGDAAEVLQKHQAATNPSVRAAVVRALATRGTFGRKLANPLQQFALAVTDEHARVRLEGVNALRSVGTAKAVELAMQALNKPVDTNLDFALWLTAWELADVWLPALERGEITFGGNAAHLTFALRAANRPEGAKALVKLAQEGKLKPESQFEILRLIASVGGPEELAVVLEMAVDQAKTTDEHRAALLNSLTESAKTRNIKPGGELNRIEGLFASPTKAVKLAALRLAGAWRLESARKALQMDDRKDAEVSAAIIESLTGFGDAAALTNYAETHPLAALRSQAVAALVQLNDAKAADLAVAALGKIADHESAAAGAIFDAYLKAKESPAKLAAALQGKKISASVATLGLQKAGAVGIDTGVLQSALQAAGGIQPMIQALTPEQLTAMMEEVKTKGDAARGEQIYRRQALACTTCHAIGAAGGIIGPDMVSLGASAPVDYIIEALLEPSKKIKEGYATTLVTTKQNQTLTGFLSREDDKEIVLRDAAGNVSTIPRGDVTKVETVPVSLMPPGLTATLRRDEFVDLVRFLSELGKEGPYKAKTGTLIRRWRVLQYSDALQVPLNKDGFRALAKHPEFPWTPAYTTVAGDLPGGDIPKVEAFVHKFCAAQGEVEVTTPGKVGFKVNDAASIQLWVGENEIPLTNGEGVAELPSGKHLVTLTWDHTVKNVEKLRVELFEAPGSPAKAMPVGGP